MPRAPADVDGDFFRGSVGQDVPPSTRMPTQVLLLAGLAVMGLSGVTFGLALALGLGGMAGAGFGLVIAFVLAPALAALLEHQLARPARAALRRAESLVRHYAGRTLSAKGDDLARLDKALDEVSGALLEHAARVRRDHLDELRNSLELQRQYALMRLLRAIAVAPRASTDLAPMLAGALHEIGQYLDWPLGRVSQFAGDGGRAGNGNWWQPHAGRFAAFTAAVDRAAAAGAAAAGGIGARALQSGMPHWITAIASVGDCVPATEAAECGLKTALAIPVLSHGRVVALIEFYADRRVEPSAEMIDVVDAICIEVSQAAEQLEARTPPRRPSRKRRDGAEKLFGGLACPPEPALRSLRNP